MISGFPIASESLSGTGASTTFGVITMTGGAVVGGMFDTSKYSGATTYCSVLANSAFEIAKGRILQMSGGLVSGGTIGMSAGYGFSFLGNVSVSGSMGLPYGFVAACGLTVASITLFQASANYTATCGMVVSGNQIKKQLPFTTVAPAATVFDLVNASINFKLEQQS